MKIKKALIIILVFSMALGLLSACGETGQKEKGFESDFIYLPKYKKIETGKNLRLGQASAKLGGRMLITADEDNEPVEGEEPGGNDKKAEDAANEENAVNIRLSYIYSFDKDGNRLEKLPAYEPLALSELKPEEYTFVYSNIERMTSDSKGNIYIIEAYYASGKDEKGAGANKTYIRKLDSAGAELAKAEADKIKGSDEESYLQGIVASDDGKLCFVSSGQVSKLVFTDENLEPAGEKKLSDVGWISGIAQNAEGKTYLMHYGNEGVVVSELDFEAKDIKKAVSVDRNAFNIYPGGEKYGFMVADNANLYGCNGETGKTEFVLSFLNSGIDKNNLKILNLLENGDMVALTDKSSRAFLGGGVSSGDNQGYEMVYLAKTAVSEAPKVETLTLAGSYIDGYLNYKILEFNKKSSDLKIKVKDYSVFNTKDDYTAGETKLLTEIGAGNIPDIFCSDSGSQQSYIKKGLLTDLMPYIDGDKELGGREALFAPVLKACMQDGKLYTLHAGFRHVCCVAPSELLPDKLVSFDAAKEAKQKLKENASYFESYMNGAGFLGFSMVLNQNDFVDYKNGTANFESRKFIDLLKMAKEMPAPDMNGEYEDPAVRLRDGKQLFMLLMNDSDMTSYRMADSLMNGKINFCSLPGSDKVFSAFGMETGLSISTSCKNPGLAWKFVRELVSEVNTYEDGDIMGAFPMNAKSFDNLMKKLMEKHMVKDENGKEVEESNHSIGTAGGESIDIYALTQAQYDALMELFENTSVINEPDVKLMEIINEETAAFFDGGKTAEETAALIQNRASIYLSEQK